MTKWKVIVRWWERVCSDPEKRLVSHRDLLIGEIIVVFTVVVWMGAMMLLP